MPENEDKLIVPLVPQGIVSKQQAEKLGWLEEPYRSNKFLERYNSHQEHLENNNNGEVFSKFAIEKLPINLAGSDLSGAIIVSGPNITFIDRIKYNHVRDGYLKGDHLTDEDRRNDYLDGNSLVLYDYLLGSYMLDQDLTGANLTGAKLDKFSLLYNLHKLEGVDFTDLQLKDCSNLLEVEESRSIIIDRMIELGIKDAKGLGDYVGDNKAAFERSGQISVVEEFKAMSSTQMNNDIYRIEEYLNLDLGKDKSLDLDSLSLS